MGTIIVNQMPKVNGWIKTTSRLPEIDDCDPNKAVLVYSNDGQILLWQCFWLTPSAEVAPELVPLWQCDFTGANTHWHHLPLSPLRIAQYTLALKDLSLVLSLKI
jgi:hypothetical protein